MSGFHCYLEREPGGRRLRRVRLVGPGLDRTWTAPPDETAAPGAATAVVRDAARWVREQLGSVTRTLDSVCLDAAGGACAWLSAPSPEPPVIQAAMRQAAANENPVALAAVSLGRSTEALAEPQATSRAMTVRRPGQAPGAAARRKFAVLTLPDAPARIFLDELDRLGIQTTAVTSLWHALAASWDPNSPAANGDGYEARAERVVSTDAAPTAIVMLDPLGRLVWAWSAAGDLAAAGSMRLLPVRRTPQSDRDDQPSQTPLARRIADDQSSQPESVELACGSDEIGRLATEWLAWSAQLGICPERIIALGAPAASAGTARNGDASGHTAPSLAKRLSDAWPDATVDVATDADPVGTTLGRLAGRNLPAHAAMADPRASLRALSNRAGRADRWMYRWLAGAVLVGAVLVGAFGYKLSVAASAARTHAADLNSQYEKAVKDFRQANPQIPPDQLTTGHILSTLNGRIATLSKQPETDATPKPVLAELQRALRAIDPDKDQVKVTQIQIMTALATVRLTVPNAEIGPRILERINKIPGQLQWSGSFPPTGRATSDGRPYVLIGYWNKEGGNAS